MLAACQGYTYIEKVNHVIGVRMRYDEQIISHTNPDARISLFPVVGLVNKIRSGDSNSSKIIKLDHYEDMVFNDSHLDYLFEEFKKLGYWGRLREDGSWAHLK